MSLRHKMSFNYMYMHNFVEFNFDIVLIKIILNHLICNSYSLISSKKYSLENIFDDIHDIMITKLLDEFY